MPLSDPKSTEMYSILFNFFSAPYNTSGWNSVYVAGKIIEKIGPILAINNEDFNYKYVVEKTN